MKKKRRQRVLAVIMATLMIVGLIPTDFGVTVAKAASSTHIFDATTISSSGVADKAVIAENTTFDSGYFKAVGVITQRVSTTTSLTTSIEVAKAGAPPATVGGSIQFTVTGTANVSINMSSTGTTNTSQVALINGAGNVIANGEGLSTVYGTSATTLTYNNLPAGTYNITSPYDAANLRGARILKATVVETATGTKSTISNVTSSITGSIATINWTAIGGSGGETTLVEYSTDAGATWTAVGTVAQDAVTTTQELKDKSSGTYLYKVTGANAAVQATASVTWVQARKDWTTVAAPSATAVQAGTDIKATWNMNIGTDGADSLVVDLLDASNAVVSTKTIVKTATAQTTGDAILTVSASGTYTVRLTAKRDGETTDKVATTAIVYATELTAPTVVSATGDGKGGVAFVWNSVNEANSYTISYKKAGEADTAYAVARAGIATTSYKVTGLSIDTNYTFKISAVRDTPAATKDVTYDKKVTSTVERVWNTAYVGTQASDNLKNGKVTANADGSVYMYASDGKLSTSNDGFAFYYTEVDSAKENFTFKATVNVTEIKDNQSGFGLLVADTLGQTGKFDLASGINYYMAGVSKTEFTPEGGVKTTYSCGTSLRKVTGCTDPTGADTSKRVLDQSNAFQTNLDPTQVVNAANIAAGTCQTTYTFTLTKDNNGYSATMEGIDKVAHAYDVSKLLQQDGEKVYVGLAVSRGTKATFSDISFVSRDPQSDPVLDPSSWDKEYAPQELYVFAGATTGSSDYNYRYYGNWAGQVTLTDGSNVLFSKYVEAGETIVYNMQLAKGTTQLITTIEPDPTKVVLKSYDPVVIEKSVTYKTFGFQGETIIVSADGTSSGKGTEESPMDIYTAVKYAQPGQVIFLKNGTYNLTSAVTIPYSVSGVANNMITLMAETAGQVILDGSQMPENSNSILVMNGDYWHVYGLDLSNASDSTKGLGISGNNNIVEMCDVHDNGTTGLQISRSSGEPKQWWPSNNLVKNCTSYNNCDPLMNDADGFAAKLTVGDGNKFYGCISHNNIDDGWDLYAYNKVGWGQIGAVVIENCVSYNNGYVPGIAKYGEGNGFKLGGEGVPGAHQLINCISFNNTGKGITSNNGPDCQVINCTSYNNNFYYATGLQTDANSSSGKVSARSNIGLSPLNGSKYTGKTNFVLKNTISVYTLDKGVADDLQVIGQDPLESENNYLVKEVGGSFTVAPSNSALTNSTSGSFTVAPSYATVLLKTVNITGKELPADLFNSLDTSVLPTRNANGTINMHGLLEISAAYASLGLGATIVTTGAAISVAPEKTTVITSPKTGDATHIYLFFTLSIMSGAALVGLYFYNKKRKTAVR